jgi:hypothetical protein
MTTNDTPATCLPAPVEVDLCVGFLSGKNLHRAYADTLYNVEQALRRIAIHHDSCVNPHCGTCHSLRTAFAALAALETVINNAAAIPAEGTR